MSSTWKQSLRDARGDILPALSRDVAFLFLSFQLCSEDQVEAFDLCVTTFITKQTHHSHSLKS